MTSFAIWSSEVWCNYQWEAKWCHHVIRWRHQSLASRGFFQPLVPLPCVHVHLWNCIRFLAVFTQVKAEALCDQLCNSLPFKSSCFHLVSKGLFFKRIENVSFAFVTLRWSIVGHFRVICWTQMYTNNIQSNIQHSNQQLCKNIWLRCCVLCKFPSVFYWSQCPRINVNSRNWDVEAKCSKCDTLY